MSPSSKKHWISSFQSKPVKRGLLLFWIMLIMSGLGFYLFNLEAFTPKKIAAFLKEYESILLISYLAVSIVRGFFLIPSTPFVIAGILLFPNQLFLVFIISLFGITFSGAFIYVFSRYLELDRLLIKKKKQMERIQKGINQHGFWIVLLWSFFPIVPTDLICYVASIMRMNFWKFIAALFVGEAVLIGIYVWLGEEVISLF